MINRFIFRNLWFIYTVFWMVLAAIQFALLRQNYEFPLWLATCDSILFTITFAILGMGLWYMVQYSGKIQRNWFELVSYHLTGVAFAMIIWIGAGTLIMQSVAADQPGYLEFLSHSVTYRVLAGALIYFLLLSVFYLLQNIKELQERMEREASLTAMLREAELNKLRAQIKPHFLFNSLNSVSALTLSDPPKAQQMVIKLSEFMRYSLSMAEESMSTLKNELYHAGLYLDIEKVRFSDRMLVEETIDETCDDWPVPAMILQPLLENAVKHGVYTLTTPSVIRLTVECRDKFLFIVITNQFDPETSSRKGTGTGLRNVSQRLATLYNRTDLITVNKTQNFYSILLKIPASRVES